jgi:hypothetical protein
MKIQEIIDDLKGLLSWSDRIGFNEINAINDIIYQLKDHLDETKFTSETTQKLYLPNPQTLIFIILTKDNLFQIELDIKK